MPEPEIQSPPGGTQDAPAALATHTAASRILAAVLSSDDTEADLPIVEGYTIAGTLGGGGGGMVYRGYRNGSDRPLAIKLLNRTPPGFTQPGGTRGWRELDLLMQLRLPALPRVIDYGWQGGQLFIATEYVEGLPLSVHCEQAFAGGVLTPLSRRQRVQLLASTARAVQSIHEEGVLHRDLKPSNIIIDARGQPMIIDLGIATLLASSTMETLTCPGAPLGTPAFMAPEQARGQRASTRSDVYALGATACQILTGHTPHPPPDIDTPLHETIRRIAQDPPRRPRELDPTLPRPLQTVLEKALAPTPADRYSSAGEFADDLERWLRHEPVLAAGLSPACRILRWLGRHPLLSTAAAAILIVISILGISAAAIWWAGLHPATIRSGTTPTRGSWAEIQSAAGLTLRRWECPLAPIPVAMELQVDPRLGAHELFLITPPDDQSPDYGQLLAFSPRDIHNPLWRSGNAHPDFQVPPLEGYSAEPLFRCMSAHAADVFAECPGDEIIALFRHNQWAPTSIRILDARGQVLFEAWHNGWVLSSAWLPGPRLLVLAGVNSEVAWRGRGMHDVVRVFPDVVMAIRPEMNVRGGWIQTPTAPGDVKPQWYKCILPAGAMDLLMPDPDHMLAVTALSARTFRLQTHYIALRLDEHCVEIPGRQVDAKYIRDGDMPDPESFFHLGELPPLDPVLAQTARPANN